MGSTGLGNTFNAVLEALYEADSDELKALAIQRSDGFMHDVAHSQRALGILLALIEKKEVTEQLADLGWLQAGLSEMAISWQQLALPLPETARSSAGETPT